MKPDSYSKWQPGMPTDISGLFVAVLGVSALVRGFDYLGGDREGVTESLSVVERAMSLPAWGVLFVISASLVLAGIGVRSVKLLVAGATMLCALYGSLAWGLTLKMIERGWPWDGWRTPVQFLSLAIVWVMVAWGTMIMAKARQRGKDD